MTPNNDMMDLKDMHQYGPLLGDVLEELDHAEHMSDWSSLAGLSPPRTLGRASGFVELLGSMSDGIENDEAGPQTSDPPVVENQSAEAGPQTSNSPVPAMEPEQLGDEVDGEFELDDLVALDNYISAKPDVDGDYVQVEAEADSVSLHSSDGYTHVKINDHEQNAESSSPGEVEKGEYYRLALDLAVEEGIMPSVDCGGYSHPRMPRVVGNTAANNGFVASFPGVPMNNAGVYIGLGMPQNNPQQYLAQPTQPSSTSLYPGMGSIHDPFRGPASAPTQAPVSAPAPGAGRRPKTTGGKTPGPAPAGVSKRTRAPRSSPPRAPASAPFLLDDDNLTEETYRPKIDQRHMPTPPTVPNGLYQAFGNRFANGEEARAYRESSRESPKPAPDVERVKKWGRLFWVRSIYEAMIDTSHVSDRNTSIHRQRFETEKGFEEADLEAAAHNVFDQALAVHEKGWCQPLVYHKKYVRGKLVDKAAHSLELRLALICELLREKKAMVDDAVRGGVTLALLVDNPTARGFTKSSNDTGNEKRGERLKKAKELEDGDTQKTQETQSTQETQETQSIQSTQEAQEAQDTQDAQDTHNTQDIQQPQEDEQWQELQHLEQYQAHPQFEF